MSTTSKRRLPVSAANAVLVGAFALAATTAAVIGLWPEAALLAVLGLAGFACALYARRPGARDVTRINAIEYSDERDRRIAQTGFAAVGVVALVASMIHFIVATALSLDHAWLPAAQLFLLSLVWAIANSVAARYQ